MTERPGYRPYEPQFELVAWGDEIWTVEGPEVAYKLAGVRLPCPTRMTVVRLPHRRLWLHSTIAWYQPLAAALEELGNIETIIAPNSYHHLHISAWAGSAPAEKVYASPDLIGKVDSEAWRPLGSAPAAEWLDELDQCLVGLGTYQEIVFFHRRSSTLIVTDLMQNFEGDRVARPLTRLLFKVGGATGPIGTTSVEVRFAATGRRRKLRAAVSQMQTWKPDGIILSHGLCYRTGAPAELKRAFAWAMQ